MDHLITQPIRVLLADDDIDDCFSFREALAEIAIPTTFSFVNDGEKLLKTVVADRQIPDVLFLDLNMPRKDGFDCLVRLKENPVTHHIPIVIISTSFHPEIIELLFAKGARHYIVKPANFNNLKLVIANAILSCCSSRTIGADEFILKPYQQ